MNQDPNLIGGIGCALVLFWIGCLLLSLTRACRQDLRFQLQLFAIAFGLRFAASVVIYQFGLVKVLGDEDSSGWIVGAAKFYQWQEQGYTLLHLPGVMMDAFKGHHQGYYYLLGCYYYLCGAPDRLPAAALNCFFGSLTVVYTYRTALLLFDVTIARRVGWWTCLFLSMIIWSAMTVKEPVVIFLEVLALYTCVRLRQQSFSVPYLLACSLTIVALVPFRFYAAYIVGGALLISLVGPAIIRPGRGFAAVFLAVILVPMVFATGSFARHETEFEKFDLEQVQKFKENIATGGAKAGANSGVKTDDVRTSGGLVRSLVVGAAHLLLAPFPWQLGASLRAVLTLPELLYWWFLVSQGLVSGLNYFFRRRLLDTASMLLVLVGFGALYSLMFGNVGLVFRQRAQLLPWLLIIIAVGIQQRQLRNVAKTTAVRSGLSRAPLATAGASRR